MKTAREYKRPASVFYLKTPPAGWAPIQGFRQSAGTESGFSSRLAYAIRQASVAARTRFRIASDLNEPVAPFSAKAVDSLISVQAQQGISTDALQAGVLRET